MLNEKMVKYLVSACIEVEHLANCVGRGGGWAFYKPKQQNPARVTSSRTTTMQSERFLYRIDLPTLSADRIQGEAVNTEDFLSPRIAPAQA